jgi:hypothetical protein
MLWRRVTRGSCDLRAREWESEVWFWNNSTSIIYHSDSPSSPKILLLAADSHFARSKHHPFHTLLSSGHIASSRFCKCCQCGGSRLGFAAGNGSLSGGWLSWPNRANNIDGRLISDFSDSVDLCTFSPCIVQCSTLPNTFHLLWLSWQSDYTRRNVCSENLFLKFQSFFFPFKILKRTPPEV